MRPLAQLLSARRGDDHQRMRRIRDQVSRLCRGWPAERVGKIVTRHLDELILPSGYAEARALPARHRDAGQDVIIVSTSGQEIVRPIGTVLGATCVVATRMEIANGHYTGSGGVLRLRRSQSDADARAGRGRTATACGLLGLPRLRHRPAHAGAGGASARGQSGPGAPQDCAPAGPAGARLRRAAAPCSGNVNGQTDRDNESITPEGYPPGRIRRRKVPRTHFRPGTAPGHPRATSRGRRTEVGAKGQLAPASAARPATCPEIMRCTLGNPGCRVRLRRPWRALFGHACGAGWPGWTT